MILGDSIRTTVSNTTTLQILVQKQGRSAPEPAPTNIRTLVSLAPSFFSDNEEFNSFVLQVHIIGDDRCVQLGKIKWKPVLERGP